MPEVGHMKLTIPIIRSVSQDAGNAHARRNGRIFWNDWNTACAEFERDKLQQQRSREGSGDGVGSEFVWDISER